MISLEKTPKETQQSILSSHFNLLSLLKLIIVIYNKGGLKLLRKRSEVGKEEIKGQDLSSSKKTGVQ